MDKKHQPARTLPRRHLLATAIGSALVSGAGLAIAAEAPRQLGTVVVEETAVPVVSSPKQTAPLLDNPQTISVIPQEVYQAQGAKTLTDVLRNTPGISFSGGENGFASNTNNFNLRGFDTSGNIFVDGARDSGSYSRDVFNLEQVEVAKGAAADNGRGGAGGYVNLVTKSPKLQNFIAGSVSYGFDEYDSKDRRRASADINQKLGDSTAVRLNLLASDGGKAGRDEVELNTLGFAPSIAFGLGTDTRAVLSYQHTEQNDIPDFGVSGVGIKGTWQNKRYAGPAAAKKADRDLFYGTTADYDDTTSDAVLLRLERDLSSTTTISNQTRWSETERRGLFTLINNADNSASNPTPGDVGRYRQGYDSENTSLSNTTNVSSHFNIGRFKHSVAAGVELSQEERRATRQAGLGASAAISTPILNPSSAPLGGTLNGTDDSNIKIQTLAAYAYDTVELSERWQVTTGLRAERYKVEIKSDNPAVDLDGSETTLGGKLGLVYKPAKNGSIYASFSSSSEMPGDYLSAPDLSRTGGNGLPGLADGVNDPDNKPRVALNFELGTKWSLFQERLLATAALFRTEKKNIAITGKDNPADPANTLKGYGKQIVEGIELGATGKLTDAWTVFAGAVFMDSERQHSRYLDRVRCNGASAGDYGGGTAAGTGALPAPTCGVTRTDGDELAFTPKVSANLWTTYKATEDLTLGLGAQHVGKQYLGRPSDADRIIKNGQYGTLPSYTVVNALASYSVNSNLTLRLNVDNVFDKKYVVASNWQGHVVDLGTSRAFLVSADFKF